MLMQIEFDLTVKRIIVVQKSQRKAKSRHSCDDIGFFIHENTIQAIGPQKIKTKTKKIFFCLNASSIG